MTAMINVKAAQSPVLHCSGKCKKPTLNTTTMGNTNGWIKWQQQKRMK
jgi:hypothetical protein